MSAESKARSYAEEFRWRVGYPGMSDEKAHLQDLLALQWGDGRVLIREQRDFLRHDCPDAGPSGDEPNAR